MKSAAARIYGVLEYFHVYIAAVLATPIVVRVLGTLMAILKT
jgi:hypothetical protein